MYKGFSVQQSAGSMGAADLKCTKGNKCHYVQVKTTTKPSNAPHISRELGRLKSTATRNGATSVEKFRAMAYRNWHMQKIIIA